MKEQLRSILNTTSVSTKLHTIRVDGEYFVSRKSPLDLGCHSKFCNLSCKRFGWRLAKHREADLHGKSCAIETILANETLICDTHRGWVVFSYPDGI